MDRGYPFSLKALSAAIRSRSLSSEDLVRSCLARIEQLNSTVNAFCRLYAQEALAESRRCDAEAARGEFRGPLHGMPAGIKDLFSTEGAVTARGSRAFVNNVPTETSPIVERLLAAGAIMIGKTTTTEFGWSGSSVSELYGETRNPWNPALTSGGSSSGSGAALAGRMVPIALGSDGGGSVRIPAAFCGIFAMKGSLGRIPAYPWSATEMLSHAGPMTVTAEDSAILFNILKGPDPRDHLSLPDDGIDYSQHRIDPAKLRIAFAPTLFDYPVQPEIAATVRHAVAGIGTALGCGATEVAPAWSDPIEIFEILWIVGRGVVYGRGPSDGFGAGFRRLVERSGRYSVGDYLSAMKRRADFAATVHRFFDEYDLLLLPTVPEKPFDAAAEAPQGSRPVSEILPWTAWTPFTYPFNISGNPAASLPCGFTPDGLPVGLQVVGRRHEDSTVMAFCRAVERAFPWHESLPPLAQAGGKGRPEPPQPLPAMEKIQ
jgi:aspartyl-tRNA(Asn)/glutamyl-tRNA(Gln) amidotransferase subunit A